MRLAAIVLASGASIRFGDEDKLAAPLRGKPLIRHVLDAILPLGLDQILLVTAPGSGLGALIPGDGVRLVTNDRHKEGMGTSIAVGVAALAPCDGAFIVPGDMPFIGTAAYEELCERFAQDPRPDIVAPVFEGQRGHPVLFGAACFGELERLEGDRGGAGLIASGGYHVELHPVRSPAILRDIDTPQELNEAEREEEL